MEIVKNNDVIQKLVLDGDLSKMTPDQKVLYYNQFCQSLGLNPLTQPFQIIIFQKKERLYATKDCTEQLRKIHGISITDVTAIELKGVYVVTAKAADKNGKTDAATGVVSLSKAETKWDDNKKMYVPTGKIIELSGDDLANALMKAETKAKRRVTLSICGLGILDETETETLKGAVTQDITAEVVEAPVRKGGINKPPPQELDNDALMHWNQVLSECGTVDELVHLFNKEKSTVNSEPEVFKLFTARKKQLQKIS